MMFFKTQKGQVVLNFIFAFFAAVVILGALFKIRHWPLADEMITLGLLSEVIVFLVMAFMVPPPEEPHWQRYFPDINLHPDLDPNYKATPLILPKGPENPALAKFDEMLDAAGITPENLGRLSDNFKSLSYTVEKMSDVSDAVGATNNYSVQANEAANALGQLKEVYQGAASTVQNFSNAADDTRNFHEQVQSLTKNLSSLNTIYELELQDTNNHLKAMNKFYNNLVQASDVMSGSVDDAKKAHDQIAALSSNLGKLNQVYGNMLTAMQSKA
jgi:gliding motility-associated protein GldL